MVVRGAMEFQIEVQPRFDYARDPHEVEMHPHGVLFRSPSLTLALEGAISKTMGSAGRLGREGDGVVATFALAGGHRGVLRARARAGGPHLPAVPGARDRRTPSRRRSATGGAGWSARATAAAGARWCTARR